MDRALRFCRSSARRACSLALLLVGACAATVGAQQSGSGVLPGRGPSGVTAAGNVTTACLTWLNGTLLCEDAADVLAQRRTTHAQTFNLYNTYTDATHFEGASIGWTPNANTFSITTTKGSAGGTMRAFELDAADFRLANGQVSIQSLTSSVTISRVIFDNSNGLTFTADNTYDVGANGATRPRTGYFGTSVVAPTVNATTGYQLNGTAGVGFALTHANPANQTGNATATFKMNGLGAAAAPCTITPTSTGRVVFFLTGNQVQSTTADGVTFKIAYGSGTAPANAAAASGTVISATQTWTALTGALQEGFAIQSIATGLTLATAYWYDLQIADVTGGTASVTNIDCTAHEL